MQPSCSRQEGVIFAGLMPHAPVLIPEVGQDRLESVAASVAAMKELAGRLMAAAPEGLVLISPHSPRKPGRFGIRSGSRLAGSLEEFSSPEVGVDLVNDEAFAAELAAQAAGRGVQTWSIHPSALDHGALVPLCYLVQAGWNGPTTVLSLSRSGDQGLVEFGHAIAQAARRLGRAIAILASGDMSHCLLPGAPGGYEPRAEQFDQRFVDCLRRGAYAELQELDPALVRLAGQDVLESTLVAVSAVDRQAAGHEVLGYQGPFGVGYGVAVLYNANLGHAQAEGEAEKAPEDYPGRWWALREDGRVECQLCPRFCRLQEGQRGFCFVRQRRRDRIVLTAYGRSSGFCVDPIEKKPLNHFYPGTSVLSFGTAGCNLGCQFCQNWEISKARESNRLADAASAEDIAKAAQECGCQSVAFTYNDPVIFAEYAIDVAQACHALGIQTVAVTAGYMTAEPRQEFYRHMDAANIDLKGFTEEFYHRRCIGQLAPVLETLEYVHRETSVWLEVTSLLIPGENDDDKSLHWGAEWFAEHLGPDVPWHFTAFHPDFKMLETPATPRRTLERARQIALSKGLRYVYTGNVHNPSGSSTCCPSCHTLLIARDRYELRTWNLASGRCPKCQTPIPGRFAAQPGAGTGQRLRVLLH